MSRIASALTRLVKRSVLTSPATTPLQNAKSALALWDNEFQEDFDDRLVISCADRDAFLKWRVTTDAAIRGKSTGSISWNAEAKTGVFEGVLDQTVDESVQDRIKKSGFAAIRSPEFEDPPDLTKYDCFEVRAKGDGKVYVLNILPLNPYMEEEWRLFQAPLVTKPGVWQNTLVPFSEFLSSYRGMIDAEPFTYNGQPIASVGILMAQRTAGPFRLEIDWIQAVNMRERKAAARYDPNHV